MSSNPPCTSALAHIRSVHIPVCTITITVNQTTTGTRPILQLLIKNSIRRLLSVTIFNISVKLPENVDFCLFSDNRHIMRPAPVIARIRHTWYKLIMLAATVYSSSPTYYVIVMVIFCFTTVNHSQQIYPVAAAISTV